MKKTDTSEKGLETIIVESLKNNAGYLQGNSEDYDRDHALDLKKLFAFFSDTQEKIVDALHLDVEGASRTQFLHRLQGEIAKRGIVDVLRTGIKHNQFSVDLFYGAPSEENEKAKELYKKNIFSVTRQLHFSKNETMLSLDMAIFINGLPLATFELKNKLTKQTVQDAIGQYKRDRDPKELLFQFGRCVVHFALDDHEVWMCTHLQGKYSWFLPFNKGCNDGAGNPPNPKGIAIDYLWKDVLNKDSLTNILENYAQIVEEKDSKNRKKQKQIFPRYHQLDVVKKLLKDVEQSDLGKRYLIQHSAGSGKSNSIAWLAHQLVGLKKNKKELFGSIIIVTDRRNLDKQIRDTIKQFAQVSAVVGAVTEGSKQLKSFIESGKKIIISTVQKFPFILKEIGDDHRSNNFAIIIDEAHSSQGGRVSSQMNVALASKDNIYDGEEEKSIEDIINELMESKKMISNANYFAFTATPKNKTLEIFGESFPEGDKIKYKAFHSYTMKQAIQEGIHDRDLLSSPQVVYDYLKVALKGLADEEIKMLFLDGRNQLIEMETLKAGTVNRSVVFPRKVVERALYHHAVGVIIAHNHPSGSLEPSEEDQDITTAIQAALKTVDIKLLDHIIIGGNEYFSFESNGLV